MGSQFEILRDNFEIQVVSKFRIDVRNRTNYQALHADTKRNLSFLFNKGHRDLKGMFCMDKRTCFKQLRMLKANVFDD